jgi:decaprenylphospho-beta-D-ribofuranose 2-oxidase
LLAAAAEGAMITRLASFDGTETAEAELLRPDRYRHLFDAFRGDGAAIARGAGLTYCGASAAAGVRSVSSRLFNRVLEFDAAAGTVRVEPGIDLGSLYRFTTPRGWILPVMPGHPSITVGGCVGCNVHGKNHCREGNFLNAVEGLTLFHPDHGEISCSRTEAPEVFRLTVGGYGLTGFITSVNLRLRHLTGSAVHLRKQPAAGLVEAVDLLEAHQGADILYSWHNFNRRGGGFGSGYVYVGEMTDQVVAEDLRYRSLTPEQRGNWPVGGLARFTTRTATRVYGWSQRLGRDDRILPLAAATFPINGKEVYFRLYGAAGFREYQVLVPRPRWGEAAERLAAVVARHGVPVGLASLKLFRGQSSYLHFDGSGVCLALDAPEGDATRRLFADLDDLTLAVGGLVNVSKDSRLTAAFVSRVYPEYERFRADLAAFDPRRRCDSALRRRLDV